MRIYPGSYFPKENIEVKHLVGACWADLAILDCHPYVFVK